MAGSAEAKMVVLLGTVHSTSTAKAGSRDRVSDDPAMAANDCLCSWPRGARLVPSTVPHSHEPLTNFVRSSDG
jgi:hypothetical protein